MTTTTTMPSPTSCIPTIPTVAAEASVETSHPTSNCHSFDSWDDFVRATLQQGDALYASSSAPDEGYWHYRNAARTALTALTEADDARRARLKDALQRARIAVIILAAFVDDDDAHSASSRRHPNYQQAAWILRKCFLSFLLPKEEKITDGPPATAAAPPKVTLRRPVLVAAADAASSSSLLLPSTPLAYPDLSPPTETPIESSKDVGPATPPNDQQPPQRLFAPWLWVASPSWLSLCFFNSSGFLVAGTAWLAAWCLSQTPRLRLPPPS